jgi:hypothetical protein
MSLSFMFSIVTSISKWMDKIVMMIENHYVKDTDHVEIYDSEHGQKFGSDTIIFATSDYKIKM